MHVINSSIDVIAIPPCKFRVALTSRRDRSYKYTIEFCKALYVMSQINCELRLYSIVKVVSGNCMMQTMHNWSYMHELKGHEFVTGRENKIYTL